MDDVATSAVLHVALVLVLDRNRYEFTFTPMSRTSGTRMRG
jgi:hypothetical protein